MIVLIHVIIALASIGVASFTFFKPSIQRLLVSYGFIVATVGSGAYLIVSMSSDILRSCLTGLFYLTVVSIVTIATHIRVRRGVEAHISTEE